MDSDRDYTAIRVSTLRGDMQIPFNVYVKVAGKYILYCRRGTSFEGARLSRLRAKKLRQMFITKADEIPYRQYLEDNITQAYKPGRPMNIRAEVIQGFQQAVAEDYFDNALDEMTYTHLRSSMQRFTEFLEREPEGIKALLEIPNSDKSISQHGVNVATLAVALTIEGKLREGIQLHLFALGCLIHDIEHHFNDLDIARPLTSFTPEELALYKEHPLKGAHRLQGVTFVDQLVHNVITQHEEFSDGSGFPKKLLARDMDPLVPVAGVANAYDRLVSFEGLPHKEALKQMLINSLGRFPLEHIQSLQNLLKRLQLV